MFKFCLTKKNIYFFALKFHKRVEISKIPVIIVDISNTFVHDRRNLYAIIIGRAVIYS